MKSTARVVLVAGSAGTNPVLCCNGGVVTVAYASNLPGSKVYVTSSSDWGLRWNAALKLSSGFANSPSISCHGADVLVSWRGYDSVQQTYALRAVRTSAR